MRIAYFGDDMFYSCMEQLIENGHEIMALYIDRPAADEYDFTRNVRRKAEMLAIPVLLSEPSHNDIKKLWHKGCDMILSAGYRYKIPPWQGGSIRYGINIHPSLLPKGAGPMPFPFVIVEGLKETGVTLHKLSQNWDEGDIILQEKIPLRGHENLEDLLCESQALAPKLLQSFLNSPAEYWDNAYPQIRQPGNYWPMPKPERFLVDYNKDVETVEKYLRAHRYISPDGNIEFVSNVTFWKNDHHHEPGTILSQENNVFLMAAADGLVSFKLEQKQAK